MSLTTGMETARQRFEQGIARSLTVAAEDEQVGRAAQLLDTPVGTLPSRWTRTARNRVFAQQGLDLGQQCRTGKGAPEMRVGKLVQRDAERAEGRRRILVRIEMPDPEQRGIAGDFGFAARLVAVARREVAGAFGDGEDRDMRRQLPPARNGSAWVGEVKAKPAAPA